MEEKELFQWDEVSLYAVLRDLLIYSWVILLAGLSVWIGVGSAAQLRYVPEYTSSATMAVAAKGTDISIYSNLMVTNQMAEVIGEVFSSNVLREQIAQDLGVEEVTGEIETTVIPETNLLTVQVTAPTAKLAHQILWSAINHYDGVSDYLFTNATLRVLQQPSVPNAPSNTPNVRHQQKLASVGAMVIVAVCCVAFTIFRPTVQTPQSAKQNLDGELLGSIPFEQKWKSLRELVERKKRSLLLRHPGVSMAFSESYRKITTRLEFRMRGSQHKVLLVTSVGENEGKSSVATNIALALAEKGRRVLLLDGDLRKPAIHKVLQLPASGLKTIKDYVADKTDAESLAYYDKTNQLYVVQSGDEHISDGVQNVAEKLCQLIQKYAQSMDYVIIDSAPMAVTSDTEYLLGGVEGVLFVVRQDWCGIDAINDKLEVLRQHHVGVEGIVLNAVHPMALHMGSRERYYSYGRYHHRHDQVEEKHEQ